MPAEHRLGALHPRLPNPAACWAHIGLQAHQQQGRAATTAIQESEQATMQAERRVAAGSRGKGLEFRAPPNPKS